MAFSTPKHVDQINNPEAVKTPESELDQLEDRVAELERQIYRGEEGLRDQIIQCEEDLVQFEKSIKSKKRTYPLVHRYREMMVRLDALYNKNVDLRKEVWQPIPEGIQDFFSYDPQKNELNFNLIEGSMYGMRYAKDNYPKFEHDGDTLIVRSTDYRGGPEKEMRFTLTPLEGDLDRYELRVTSDDSEFQDRLVTVSRLEDPEKNKLNDEIRELVMGTSVITGNVKDDANTLMRAFDSVEGKEGYDGLFAGESGDYDVRDLRTAYDSFYRYYEKRGRLSLLPRVQRTEIALQSAALNLDVMIRETPENDEYVYIETPEVLKAAKSLAEAADAFQFVRGRDRFSLNQYQRLGEQIERFDEILNSTPGLYKRSNGETPMTVQELAQVSEQFSDAINYMDQARKKYQKLEKRYDRVVQS